VARNTSESEPGHWFLCSGENDYPLADGPNTYAVTSSAVSTIVVTIYDGADPSNRRDVPEGGRVNLKVKGSLFVGPKPSDSGTAEGTFYVVAG